MSQRYKVSLPLPFDEYEYVELISERASWNCGDDPYVVVWLGIEKVKYYTQQGGQGWPSTKDMRQRDAFFRRAWNPHNGKTFESLAYMPRISSLIYEEQIRPTFYEHLFVKLGLIEPKKIITKFDVIFGRGRHRTEFLLSRGVKCMPFETRKSNVELLLDFCSFDRDHKA